MSKLVIVTHPGDPESVINRRWVEELKKHSDITVHELYKVYPDEQIDIKKEQALVDAHDTIVFQFPVWWYSAPSLLKKWMDVVFTPDWAYLNNYALEGKKIALAVTAGGTAADYTREGSCKASMEDILKPFIVSCSYIKAVYSGVFECYNTFGISAGELDKNAEEYAAFVENL